MAGQRPDWQLVLLGPVAKIDPAALPRLPNLHYLGMKPYPALPDYLAGWDVGILPFAHNDATRFISPTKTPEYLAAGLPVVATSIRDVVEPYGTSGLARIADGAAAFVAAIEAALARRALPRLRAGRRPPRPRFLGAHGGADAPAHAARRGDGRDGRGAVRGPGSRPGRAAVTGPVRIGGRRRYDFLVVGAGFAGSVVAERLATYLDARVLLVDCRPHIGGNAYDHYDDAGILVHRYGPHIFHTASRDVFEYLSRFTEWRSYQHRVLAAVDGQLVPIPINLDTINQLTNSRFSSSELDAYFAVAGRAGRRSPHLRGRHRQQGGTRPL